MKIQIQPSSANSALTSTNFSELFAGEALQEVFHKRFSNTLAKGLDRINGFQFRIRAVDEFNIASKKCMHKSYRFAPYLEKLALKGRGKTPRIISIPTVRDRVILHQLKEYLGKAFPECIPKNTASVYVQLVQEQLVEIYNSRRKAKALVCNCDIRDFYPSIDRGRLMKTLERKGLDERVLNLVHHATSTPTVPRNTRRIDQAKYCGQEGVPQGLAISNILAAIYLKDVDAPMRKLGVNYYRYVDDILIFGTEKKVRNAYKSVVARLRARSLRVHPIGESEKSNFYLLSDIFGYLGYHFQLPNITVRPSSKEKFLQSICAKITEYKHNKIKCPERYAHLGKTHLRQIFLLELNERITGAISEKRRYGWLAYFSSITDLTLLHQLDRTISLLIGRLDDFEGKAPAELKRLSRAYFEIKFRPDGGYIPNYDQIQTRDEKLRFLMERGLIKPGEELLAPEIEDRFERYRRRVLTTLQPDESTLY